LPFFWCKGIWKKFLLVHHDDAAIESSRLHPLPFNRPFSLAAASRASFIQRLGVGDLCFWILTHYLFPAPFKIESSAAFRKAMETEAAASEPWVSSPWTRSLFVSSPLIVFLLTVSLDSWLDSLSRPY
jgi:hypothetical protein